MLPRAGSLLAGAAQPIQHILDTDIYVSRDDHDRRCLAERLHRPPAEAGDLQLINPADALAALAETHERRWRQGGHGAMAHDLRSVYHRSRSRLGTVRH